MLILAIDTALDVCATAVLDTTTGLVRATESLPMTRGHAEALMPLIARVVDASGIGFADLARIAVTVGPGSFTGLRVGISAARGIALAAERPAVGVTTLSAFAAPLIGDEDGPPILSAIDARHDHVYAQLVSAQGDELIAPCVIAIEALLARVDDAAPRLVGNAATLLAQRWPAAAASPVQVDNTAGPDITAVGWLGAAADPTRSPPKPFYLRAVDARPMATTAAAAP